MSTTRRSFLNLLSYLAIVFVGIALLLQAIFNMVGLSAQIVNALNILAQVMAYIVVAFYSFGYARARGTWWLVVWAIAVVLIVVFLVLGNISFK
ncbi:MAG: hypothetical protein NC133_02760 [Prevotella sp.]|nr:hypothetical protein [Prevotella sp.]